MTPKALIREARKNFWFAVMQWGAVENGHFWYRNLPSKVNWTIEGETRNLEWYRRSDKGFKTLVLNQLRAALGIATIQIDSVLTDYFCNKPYLDTDPDRKAARCIIYMIRCAFAHNPLEAKWEIKNQEYSGVFSVPSINFTLDTTNLDGRPLDDANMNWFRLFDLMDYCENLVT